MFDAEANEVRTGSRRMVAFVSAIPAHLVFTSVERRVYQRVHELALDVVDRYADGCDMGEVEAEMSDCVEGVGPNLERGCRYRFECFGRRFGWSFCGASG